MMDITNILQHLFKEQSLEKVTLTSVQDLAERYPYFAAAQFLLAKKMMQEYDSGFDDQLQKTNLYFHNTLWLHHILEDSGTETVSTPDLPISGTKAGDTTVLITPAPSEPVTEPDASEMETTASLPEAETDFVKRSAETPVTVESAYSAYDPGSEEENNGIDGKEGMHQPQEPAPDGQATTEKEISDNSFPEERETAPEEINTHSAPEDSQLSDLPADSPQEDSMATAAYIRSQAAMPEKTPASRTVIPKEELAFDPYHTIDYFASLGIRLSQEPKPDDKLGQQLKSFTAWLKTMRRLPEANQPEPVEVNQADLNAHIEKIAAHSLIDREVITQAMAEVLVLQGNREKAEEIYHKLSLLNPDKSAYFAAKIVELKRH